MSPALSVIVVNYNAGRALEDCLESLDRHLSAFDWEAVVVDNRSTDASERATGRFGPRVSLVRNPANLGFGRAVNGGMARTRAPFVLLLNPDARLLPDAVDPLVATLRCRPECAVVGPAVVNEDGTPQGSARGDPDMLTGIFGRSTLLTRLAPRLAPARRNVVTAIDLAPGESSTEVDWVSGACMLMRREAVDRVGGFDERYFLYWEDADICRRLRGAGYRIRYQPGARVVHLVGQSSRSAGSLATRAFHQSAYLYYATHVRPSRWHPARWLAYTLLELRCRWLMARGRTPGR